MKIVRVHYEHQTDPRVKNTFVDFELTPSQEKVEFIEVREIIPQHTKVLRTFQGNGSLER